VQIGRIDRGNRLDTVSKRDGRLDLSRDPLPVTGRVRLAILLVVILAVTGAHYLTPTAQHGLHALYRWFYYLPIILGAFWFGLRGGAGLAAFVTAVYLPHVFLQWGGGGAIHWLEIALYHVVGWVTGGLAQQLRGERDRFRRAAEDLERAYGDLKESTRQLLETEQQLRHADRLAVLGELSAGLAHEIRTPLASIRGAAEILSGAPEESDRVEFAGILVKEVERLNRVVTGFLEFSRPSSGGRGQADLAAAVAETLRLLRLQADRTGVRLTEILPDGIGTVAMDEEPLKQVVVNLVMNAVQASARGGEVRIRAETVGDSVSLSVEDDGVGISAADADRVFEPFVTTRPDGTGLGLSVVRKILDRHGGSIRLEAGGGGGTTARVLLPRTEDAP
jgi:signal transduction histidine kinase